MYSSLKPQGLLSRAENFRLMLTCMSPISQNTYLSCRLHLSKFTGFQPRDGDVWFLVPSFREGGMGRGDVSESKEHVRTTPE